MNLVTLKQWRQVSCWESELGNTQAVETGVLLGSELGSTQAVETGVLLGSELGNTQAVETGVLLGE